MKPDLRVLIEELLHRLSFVRRKVVEPDLNFLAGRVPIHVSRKPMKSALV